MLSIAFLVRSAKASLLLAAITVCTQVNAQVQVCGFDTHHQQLMMTNPDYQQRVADFNDRAERFDVDELRGGGTLFVPVVVHVMETGTAITAITDDQIRDGIRWLNERWRKVAGTPGAGNGVDTNIEFALAARDPNGNCTNGITRHDMTGNATYMASGVFDASSGISDASLKLIGVWPQTQYYNIWLVSEFDNNNGGNGTQGYAYFSGSHGQPEDGTVILVNSYKDATSITLAHELGHAFNVYHTFEGDSGGNCPANVTCGSQGDLVCDTPPHLRSTNDCNVGGTNACDGGSSNALFKNNYMDYSGDACQNMFTAGQNVRIQGAITTDRASFLAVNGNMSLVPPGAPTMDMVASSALLCGVGQSVRLWDYSTCIPNTYLADPGLPGITFAWTITNGTETHNSSVQNPTFTLNSLGIYNVTLSITTSLGTYNRTEHGMVIVAASPVAACTPTSANTGNFAQTVSNVTFNTINNNTDWLNNTAYTNLACSKNTVVAAGSTHQLSVTINAGPTAAEQLNGYIDYNNNGVFEDPSERVITGSTATNTTTTLTANVTIPGGAMTNTLLRMRIYGEAGTFIASERTCGSALFIGDVEDYGVYITNSMASVTIAASPGSTISYGTNVTFTPTPVNGGGAPVYTWYRNGVDVGTGPTYASNTFLPGETMHCSMASNLAGVIGSPDLSNVITMTVTGPPLSEFTASPLRVCTGSNITFTDQSLLSPTSWSWTFTGGTPSASSAQNPVVSYAAPGIYNVTLVASNANGTGSIMTKTGYITVYATPATGCTVTREEAPAAGIGITNVTLNTINKNTTYDDAVMNNFTCSDITVLNPNTLYNISVTVGPANTQWVRVYIDYNGNGVFTDGGEQIFAPANGMNVRSGTFTTPVAPTGGVLRRMRVISDFVNTAAGSCTSPLEYGQVEEYGIVFTTPVNNAPVLNTTPSPAFAAVNEDAAAPTGAVGTLVSTLVDLNPPAGGLDNVTDADAGAVTGIAITAADATNGSWFYSINNGGAWNALGSPSAGTSRLLAADANSRLYFQPNANFNGNIASAITFRAWDQTSGTNGSTASTSTNGGATAFSANTDVASLTVNAVNDAPVLNSTPSPALAAQNEDSGAPSGAVGTLVSSLIDLNPPAGGLDNATDIDAGPVTGIAITSVDAANGSWFYSINNGGAWSAVGIPSASTSRLLAADANVRLYFQPNANFNGNIASAITFRAWDQSSGTNGSTGDASVNGGTTAFSVVTDVASLAITGLNDAPTLIAAMSPALSAQNEDAGAPLGAVGTLVSALIDLNPPAGGMDNVTDPDAGAVTGIALIAVDATNGSWFYSINNGGAWNALGTPTGTVSRLLAADANTRIYFQPNADFSSSVPSAITFRAWDQTSGTNGGTADASVNGGTTAFSSATDNASMSINGVNDAPVLNAGASPSLGSWSEDSGAPSGAVGFSVLGLVDFNPPAGGLDNVTDVDPGAITGIAVTAADATNGTWHYSINNGGAWTALGTPTAALSRLLAANANTRLYFQPNANFNGSIASAITFRAWDQTAGTNGGTASTTSNGGTTPYSTSTDVASLTITGVNDAPVLATAPSPALGAQTEDAVAASGAVGTLVSALIDLNPPAGGLDNATDIDAAPVTGIAISTANASNGAWFYSIDNGGVWSPMGSPTTLASQLLAADANTRIYFQPNANFNGSIASAITFRAWDQSTGVNGGTAPTTTTGGTTAFSTATDVASIVVNAVNDIPLNGVPGAQAVNQNSFLVFSSGNGNLVSVSDIDAGAGNMEITLTATNGTMTLSGTTGLFFTSGDGTTDLTMVFQGTVSAVNTAMNGMTYTPTTNYSGPASLTINSSDLGNTGAGGTQTDNDVISITVNPTSVQLNIRVFLEGPYSASTGLMGDGLRSGGHIPATEPYTGFGYTFVGGGGGTVAPAVLAVTGNNAIVDWIIAELRDNSTPTTIIASTPALIQADGDVVANDGVSPLSFNVASATYRIAVKHRNHLAAMTLNGVPLSTSPTTVDFTSLATNTFGTDARKSIAGTFPAQVLWAGDVTFNGQIKYAGGGNDRDPILVKIGGLVPTATVSGYWREDVNMNGQVKYAGGANDRDPILVNIGGSVPTAVRIQQMP